MGKEAEMEGLAAEQEVAKAVWEVDLGEPAVEKEDPTLLAISI